MYVPLEECREGDKARRVAGTPQFQWRAGATLERTESSDAAPYIPYLLAGERLPEEHEPTACLCDMFFVLGSRNSSNSVRLVEVAKKAGCNNSLLMHSEKEIPFNEIDNSNTIGISSGASAPEKLVQTLLDNIRKDRKVSIEEVIVAEEKVIFKLPKELN